MKRAVLILALFAAASCVDTPTVGETEQLESGDDPDPPEIEPCDQDGDGSINPECGGCDLDDGNPDKRDDPDCGMGCPSAQCYPPPRPPVRSPG